MASLPNQHRISQDSSGGYSHKQSILKYGNGIVSSCFDGVNTKKSAWKISYGAMNAVELATFRTFYDANVNGTVEWKAPDSLVESSWRFASKISVATQDQLFKISFTIEYLYDV